MGHFRVCGLVGTVAHALLYVVPQAFYFGLGSSGGVSGRIQVPGAPTGFIKVPTLYL